MRLNRTAMLLSICLLLFGAFVATPNAAFAQQKEKRIALVIGDGAYAKVPLATAANDGGLIAQTLQAAGFDVAGARDLDGDTLRGAFRDFMKKAEDSGPNTVAVVYLAGYGIQYAGENYFIPVDSTIAHDTDIPIEGLRIGDYMRQLAALPLKLSVVVLDIAREQPFVEGGSIASGLALVEPNSRMLIAFNAAPGTVAPEEQGAYGVYAQALAEMIRTGGLPLPELFNRVRLRVNESTKGAQVPWDTQKVDDAQFMFFDRAPDAPAAPSDQVAAVRDKPIRDLGASDAYLAALDRDTLQGYEDFIAAYPRDPMAKRVRAIVAARREAITWRRSYRADTPGAYWSYLRRYPRGPHAADARRRLAILSAALEPPQTFTALDYDVPPPPPDEVVYVDRPVLMFSDPEFDFAPPPPPVFFLPPPPPDFVVLEPPPPPVGLFFLPSPLFVPIPAYVSAPAYVQPPPNNVIFNNIHNTTVINTVINRPPPATAANPAAPLVNPAAPKVAPGARTAPVQSPAMQAQVNPPAAHTGAGPALPMAVMRRATLIQQGKAPVPRSASINPAAKAGSATERAGKPPGPRRAIPAAGVTQAQPGTAQPSTTPPATAPAATGQPPATAAQPGQPAPGSAPASKQLPKTNALPVPGTKEAPPIPAASTPKPAATAPGTGPASGVRPSPTAPRGGVVPSPAAPPVVPKPGAATSPQGTQTQPELRRPGPSSRSAPTAVSPPPRAAPAVRSAPSPRHAAPAARPAAPASHAAPPPRRMATPPRPAPPRRVASPPRPAPRAAPPRMAPPPRAAPPPGHVAPPRAAPPPRPAARPAPPPHRAAPPAAKKCPPNVARC